MVERESFRRVFPCADIDVDPTIPKAAAYWLPSDDDLTDDEGFGYFRDNWVIADLGPGVASGIVEEERKIIDGLCLLADSPDHFAELATAVEGRDSIDLPAGSDLADVLLRGPYDEPTLDGLEIGVAGLTYALAEFGAFPAASCRGHGDRHAWSDHPVVYFAASRRVVQQLQPLVEESGCGFTIDPARPELLVILAPSVFETSRLAGLVINLLARVPHRDDVQPALGGDSQLDVQSQLKIDFSDRADS
ncbi:hypothetical protein [Frankia sp. Mgl5]|nr:hypothetical protein [Frankia sp. Mgl5]